MALGIKHEANHTGRLASIENGERCWVAQIAAIVWKHFQDNPTGDCLPLGNFKQSFSLPVIFEGLLIELAVEKHSQSRLRRETTCLICTTKRVPGRKLPSLIVLCDGRLRKPSVKLHQIFHRGNRLRGKQLWSIKHSTACQQLVPVGRLSAQPTPWKMHPTVHLFTLNAYPLSHRREWLWMFQTECWPLLSGAGYFRTSLAFASFFCSYHCSKIDLIDVLQRCKSYYYVSRVNGVQGYIRH